MATITRVIKYGGHRYFIEGDNRVDPKTPLPSCSAIAGYADKSGGDGLLYWAVNLYKETGNRTEFIAERDSAISTGSKLHAEINEFIEEKKSPENASALYGQWFASLQESGVQWVASEMMGYHPLLLYGGTLDAIGYLDGVPTLFDWKTTTEYRFQRDSEGVRIPHKAGSKSAQIDGFKASKKRFSDNVGYAVQVGGYIAALRAMSETDKIVLPTQAYLVYVFKDTGNVHWEKVNVEAAVSAFLMSQRIDAHMKDIKSEGGLYVQS